MEPVAANDPFARYEQITAYSANPRENTANPNTRHYIWTAGDTVPHREVPGDFIRRGRVTPILAMPQWDRADDVPNEMRVRVRTNEDGFREAMYLIPPEPIFQTVMDGYSKWGVTELTALRGWEAQDVHALEIDRLFFPDGVPATYAAMQEAIDAALERLKSSPQFPLWNSIAADMRASIARAIAHDHQVVDDNEAEIERSKTQAGANPNYGSDAERAMARLQRERKDKAMIASAARSNAIMEALPQMLERMAAPASTPSVDPNALATAVLSAAEKMAEQMFAAKLAELNAAKVPEKPQPQHQQHNSSPRKN